MKFRCYDALNVFNVAASKMSFTQAAAELNLTKGAVSYQIKRLEEELGFAVFYRAHGGVSLTHQGRQIFNSSKVMFEDFEAEVYKLKTKLNPKITIGMSTYFASRWLASRLMSFTTSNSNIGIRLQPMIDLEDLKHEAIDMAIRWGNGKWSDMNIELLFTCPAIATAGKTIMHRANKISLDTLLKEVTLLHDRDDSQAWNNWHQLAELPYRPHPNSLVIPDPNVRVEAVINGQGLALNDALIIDEIEAGKLYQISSVKLKDYGYYLAYPDKALNNPAVKAFRDWILEAASDYKSLDL